MACCRRRSLTLIRVSAGSGRSAERERDAPGEAAQSGGGLPAAEQHAHDGAVQGGSGGVPPLRQLKPRCNAAALLFQLCTQIEQLEKENRDLKEEGGASISSPPPSSTSSPMDGELLRLQAENSTLQKKMKGEAVITHLSVLYQRGRFHPPIRGLSGKGVFGFEPAVSQDEGHSTTGDVW